MTESTVGLRRQAVRRRLVLASLGAAVLPGRVVSQPPPAVHRIGVLSPRAGPVNLDEAFSRRLGELGYPVGQSVIVEYRFAADDARRLRSMARELAGLDLEAIVVSGNAAVREAIQATSRTPIVMAGSNDPVHNGFVASLGHPDRNLTGLTLLSAELMGKRLQLMRELAPRARRMAELSFPDTSAITIDATRAAARGLGLEVVAARAGRPGDLARAFDEIDRQHADALLAEPSAQAFGHLARIAELAARHRLPAISDARGFARAGGLASYGPDLEGMYRRAADYVARIVEGARPGDLAIEQPAKLELVVNLAAARALGISVPQSVLLRADDVIR